MERSGTDMCLYMLWFMMHVDHSSLTSRTEILWMLLLKEDEVNAMSSFLFYWINSHRFPGQLFMW